MYGEYFGQQNSHEKKKKKYIYIYIYLQKKTKNNTTIYKQTNKKLNSD